MVLLPGTGSLFCSLYPLAQKKLPFSSTSGYRLALLLPVPASAKKASLLLRLRVPARSFAPCTRWLSFNLSLSGTDKFMYLLYLGCFDFWPKNPSFSFHKSTGNKIFPGHPPFSYSSGYRFTLLLPVPAGSLKMYPIEWTRNQSFLYPKHLLRPKISTCIFFS